MLGQPDGVRGPRRRAAQRGTCRQRANAHHDGYLRDVQIVAVADQAKQVWIVAAIGRPIGPAWTFSEGAYARYSTVGKGGKVLRRGTAALSAAVRMFRTSQLTMTIIVSNAAYRDSSMEKGFMSKVFTSLII